MKKKVNISVRLVPGEQTTVTFPEGMYKKMKKLSIERTQKNKKPVTIADIVLHAIAYKMGHKTKYNYKQYVEKQKSFLMHSTSHVIRHIVADYLDRY